MKHRCFSFNIFYLVSLLTVFFFDTASAQQKKHTDKKVNTEVTQKEKFRKLGYDANLLGEQEIVLKNYEKVLQLDSIDYDALLATARLHYKSHDYKKAFQQYNKIYKSDPSDVEALNGMGECDMRLKKIPDAIIYFQRALVVLPNYIPLHFNLAKAYMEQGELNLAKHVYENSMKYDNTYAEAWAGIGKILFWKNKPKHARVYYEKAISLDPSDEKIKAEYKLVQDELALQVSLGILSIEEEEEVYQLKTFLFRLGATKRLTDYFRLSVNSLLDRSKRNGTIGDTLRHFDNTIITPAIVLGNHQLAAFIGASSSDARVTAYGAALTSNFAISILKIKTIFTGGYDYFYYWKKVDQNYFSNFTRISLLKLSLDLSFKKGVVRKNYIWDYKTIAVNPFVSYNIGLNYTLFINPKITFTVNHSYVNYEAHSLLYYSPYQRSINGISISPYFTYRKFYLYGSYSYRMDNYSNKIWNGEAEIGYNLNKITFSAGWRHYNDPYYKNSGLYVLIKKLF